MGHLGSCLLGPMRLLCRGLGLHLRDVLLHIVAAGHRLSQCFDVHGKQAVLARRSLCLQNAVPQRL